MEESKTQRGFGLRDLRLCVHRKEEETNDDLGRGEKGGICGEGGGKRLA